MSKMEYFAQSREENLPNRCPILNRCARRFATIRLVNKEMKFPDFISEKPEVPISGGDPYMIGGTNNFLIADVCPEVALFESAFFIIGLNHAPTTKGQYDKYMDPQYQVIETGHFSECAEYSLASTDLTLRGLTESDAVIQILTKLAELRAAVQEAKLDQAAKQSATAAIEEARESSSPKTMKTLVEKMNQVASLVGSGTQLAMRAEELGHLIRLWWP